MLKTKAIRYYIYFWKVLRFQTLAARTMSCVVFLFHSLAVFIPSTEPLHLPRRRGLLEFRGRVVQFLRQRQRRRGSWRQRRRRRTKHRRSRRDSTGAWTQTPSDGLHRRNTPTNHTITHQHSLHLSLFYIFLYFLPPKRSLCLLMHATSFFCSAYKPFFCFTTSLFVFLRWELNTPDKKGNDFQTKDHFLRIVFIR